MASGAAPDEGMDADRLKASLAGDTVLKRPMTYASRRSGCSTSSMARTGSGGGRPRYRLFRCGRFDVLSGRDVVILDHQLADRAGGEAVMADRALDLPDRGDLGRRAG